MIYALVFTAEEREREIDWSYKPPMLLSISQASRALYAKSYYTGITAVFNYKPEGRMKLSATWLKSLPESHRAMIKTFRMVLPKQDYGWSPEQFEQRKNHGRYVMSAFRTIWQNSLRSAFPRLESLEWKLQVEDHVVDAKGVTYIMRSISRDRK